MRAPRARRWGLELIWGAGAGAGRRAGEKGQGGKKGGRPLRTSSPLSHPLAIPTSTPLGICTCKEEQAPSLTLTPGCKGSVLRHPKVTRLAPTEPPHSSPLPSSPCALWPALLGWCPPRAGELLHCVLEKTLGKGRDADSPLVPALSLLSLLSPHGSFSPNVLRRGAPSKPPRSLRFLGSLPSPKAQPACPHLGGAAHTGSVSECCVCAGACGAWRGHSALYASDRRNSPEAETLYTASSSLSPETQTHRQANFGVSVYRKGSVVW